MWDEINKKKTAPRRSYYNPGSHGSMYQIPCLYCGNSIVIANPGNVNKVSYKCSCGKSITISRQRPFILRAFLNIIFVLGWILFAVLVLSVVNPATLLNF